MAAMRVVMVSPVCKVAGAADRTLRRWRIFRCADQSLPATAAAPSLGGAEGRVVLAELQHALQALPAEQRAVVLLVGLEQFSYAETAQVLDVPIGTVMSRLSRGRERLRQLLDRGPDVAAPPALKRVK